MGIKELSDREKAAAAAERKKKKAKKPPKPAPEPSALDAKLRKVVEDASFIAGMMVVSPYGEAPKSPEQYAAEITDLIKQGANPEAACAVHVSSAVCFSFKSGWSPLAVDTLIAARANVNHADKTNGNTTALHVTAEANAEVATEALLKHGADPLLKDAWGCTPLELFTQKTTTGLQSSLDHEAARGWIGRENGAAAQHANEHLPCALLLQRATEARKRQLPQRTALVKALMYFRRFNADVLRKIDASVEPPPAAEYPDVQELLGLLPPGTQVVLGGDLASSGAMGEIRLKSPDVATSSAQKKGFYVVDVHTPSIPGGHVGPMFVKPKHVLPLTKDLREDMGEEDDDSDEGEEEAEFDEGEDEFDEGDEFADE